MAEALRGVDANLLDALVAILGERNLTRAGERLGLSQPAMSAALKRLRRHYDDELVIRVRRGFELTPRGEALLPTAVRAVRAAADVLEQRETFDAATSTKHFSISLSPYAMTVVAAPINAALAEQAPGCSITYDGLTNARSDFDRQLLRRDLVISPIGFGLPGELHPLFEDRLVCVVARANDRASTGMLTLEDLASMPHAVAEFELADPVLRPLEREFERNGIDRRPVRVKVSSLLTLPYAVAGTDLCAFVPLRLARQYEDLLDLRVVDTALASINITEAVHWDPQRTAEPAVRWLRQILYDVAIDLADTA